MSEIRDLAPLMTSRDLLERLLATVDEVVNDEPARGSIRGCAITLAARLEQAEKILAADEVCACLDETGGRQVRIFERCERCGALMESDLPEQLAEQSDSADEWREQWEKANQRAELAERALKDARMKERALTDYFADASRRADEWQQGAERAERERDAVHVRLCEERDRVAAMEAALYLAWYETRRAALANPGPEEGT